MYDVKQPTGLHCSPSPNFATLLNLLARPDAFPFAVPDDEPVQVIQTHASVVLLTPEHVYKLKKPHNFGFFDYSTPALRRHFCRQEVLLNTRLAPGVYLGVAPVLAFPGGRFRFGPTVPTNESDALPLPGALFGGGYVVDYAVVMVRLPDEATLEFRVRADTTTPTLLAEVADSVATFHITTRTDEHIARFGGLEVIQGNWEENFVQMQPFIGRTLDQSTYDRIVGYIRCFLEDRHALFESRVRHGRIRDCHGDLRLQHVYLLDEQDHLLHHLPHIAILDGIEFNERFRYGDVAGEIAFLTMELDAASRPDLSRAFVERYVAKTGDEALRELLPFYSCYRACVRGKVTSFQLDEPEVPAIQREMARQEAATLFALAGGYASGPTRPVLLMVGGLMGTGKSALAGALQHELGWALFSSDTVRKRLAQCDPAQRHADAFGQGLYSQEWTARTYRALHAEANAALAQGRSVLLDASFIRRADRQAVAREAAARGAAAVFVECVCPREMALQRLARRWQAHMEGCRSTTEDASFASDGRPDLYDAQRSVWETFALDMEPQTKHLLIPTTGPLAVTVEQVLDALHIPRFACWLQQ